MNVKEFAIKLLPLLRCIHQVMEHVPDAQYDDAGEYFAEIEDMVEGRECPILLYDLYETYYDDLYAKNGDLIEASEYFYDLLDVVETLAERED
jgi:hypothetical protein